MWSLLDVGVREGSEVGLIVVLMARMGPRPGLPPSVRRFGVLLGAAVCCGTAAGLLVREMSESFTARGVASVQIGVLVMAAAAMTSAGMRAFGRVASAGSMSAGAAGALVVSAAAREVFESVWFVTSDGGSRAGSVVLVLIGVFGGAVAVGAASLVAARWLDPSSIRVIAAGGLLICAAWMVGEIASVANAADWRPFTTFVVLVAYAAVVALVVCRQRIAVLRLRRRALLWRGGFGGPGGR